jgi:hypothetical protein
LGVGRSQGDIHTIFGHFPVMGLLRLWKRVNGTLVIYRHPATWTQDRTESETIRMPGPDGAAKGIIVATISSPLCGMD